MNSYEKATLMAQERNELMTEIVELQKQISRAVFAFITVAGAMIVAGVSKEVLEDVNLNRMVVFALSQVEFFIAIYIIAVTYNMFCHAIYIMAIESKINRLAGERIAMWQSIASEHLWGRKSILLWGLVIMIAGAISAFVYCVYQQPIWARILGYLEIAIALSLIVWLVDSLQAKRILKQAQDTLESKPDEPSSTN